MKVMTGDESGDTGDESDDSETSNINVVIKNFEGQIIQWTDGLSYASVSKMSEAYLEAFKMVLYAEKNHSIKLLTFFLGKKAHLKCLTKF